MRCLVLIFVLIAKVASAQQAPQVDNVMDRVSDRLPDIRAGLANLETAPETGDFWTTGQDDIQADLDQILDEIIAIIVGEDFVATRGQLFELDDQIADAELQLEEMRIARITASPSPQELSLIDRALWRSVTPDSQEDYDLRIASTSEQIETLTVARNRIIGEFRRRLSEQYEIDLSVEQARAILYQINGSSIAEAAISVSVLGQIEQRLAEIRTSTSNDEILRRYYGLAAALRLVAVRLHERHLIQYEQDWLPALESLDADQQQLIANTQIATDAEQDADRRRAYENNLTIQQAVADVIVDYRNILLERKEIVIVRLEDARGDAALAVNTLRTLENAALLFDQFSWHEDEFRSLLSIPSADLIPLDDAEVSENYLDLSRQMLGS